MLKAGDRFASERLAMTYEQLVPVNIRTTSRKKETKHNVESSCIVYVHLPDQLARKYAYQVYSTHGSTSDPVLHSQRSAEE